MEIQRAKQALIVALIATVVLQLVYMASLGGPQPAEPGQPMTGADVIRYFDERGPEIKTVWMIEAIAFLTIALSAFVMLARGVAIPLALAALGLSGVFNTIQIGMGLAMFEPAQRFAGDDIGLFYTFVGGAFFYYFVAKTLVGLAGFVVGLKVAAQPGGASKAIGWLAVITGLAALVAGITAMALGFPALLAAGAIGTLATLFAALALGRLPLSD